MKVKFSFLSVVSRVCAVLMAFLGFSCHKAEEEYLCMYGAPTGTWEIKGEVTDEANEPVDDATIKVTYSKVNSSEHSFVTTTTDEAGNYIASREGVFEALKVVCFPNNPDLKADSTIVNLKYSGADKNDPWSRGNASATVNFRLGKKEN